MADPTTTELATGGPTGVLVAGFTAIARAGNQTLTFNRGVVDPILGFVLRPIDAALEATLGISTEVATRRAVSIARLPSDIEKLLEDLGGALDFAIPQSLSLESLLEKLSQLLLNPVRGPGEPCLAPGSLLQDLLDVALGRIVGGINETVATVSERVQDLLFPAFASEQDLGHFIQAVLADPITAALNLVLGQRNQIDCEVTARKDVGESVIEAGFKRLVGFVDKVLA